MRNDILKKIVIAVIIVAVILVLLFVGREIAIRFFGYKTPSLSKSVVVNTEEIKVTLDSEMTYSHIVSDKYVYYAGTDSVLVIDENGEQKAELSVDVENPSLKSSGSYVALGDIGGNNVYIINGTEIKKNIQTTKAIKNISVNASGSCVVVTEGDMQKRDVTVYSEKGEELFVWTSGNKLVMDAAIANNNKNIIISSLDTQTATASTVLNFFNISKVEPIATETFESEIISSISTYENYVYCVGESKTAIYNISGDKKGEIPYSDKTLLSYEVSKGGIVMAFSQTNVSDKRYNIDIYSETGAKRTTYKHDFEGKYLDASNNYIVIGRSGLICVLDYNGLEKQLLDPGVDIEDLCFIGNTKKAVGFAANGAYLINVE